MKRSKTQAVYRFLPEMWISEKDDSERAVSAKIKNWNYIKMSDIYEDFIEGEIKRQIKLFGDRGGDISAFDLSPDTHSFSIVETACNEGIPDIIGEISPLVFYCSSCGAVSDLRNPDAVDKYTWKCKNPDCGKWAVKQLQMIYACECGYAQPIKIPHVQGVKNFKFRPNETQYKMFYRSGNSEKPAEFVQICPNCNSRLVPDNANSGRNYKPFTLKVINLVDQRNGQFYKKGIDAQKTIVCRWFDKLSTADYEEILNNIELAFSDAFKSDAQRRNVKQQVRALIDAGMLPPEMFESAVNNMLQNAPNTKSVERYVAICDDLFSRKKTENPVGYAEWLSHFSFKLMQYDTLKYAKRIITLEEAIQRQLDMEFIDSPEEVTALNKKMGIANMQVSCDIQIINCTYGYSRRVADPKNSTNKNCRLKLNAYDRTRDGTANLVYGAKLDTEGILFEINAISCLDSAEGAMYEIPEHVKPILRKSQLFTVIPRIYCEQCGSYEIPYCAECGKPMECDENVRLHCSCGAPFHVQCFEGHRACRVENWYIPTSRMYTMINQNIHAAFKQDTADLVMCIMGSALYIAQPCIVRTEGVEVFFNQIDCFSRLPATAKENTKKYAVYLGEKCDGTCSNAKIGRCIADSSMACLPKAFYTLLPGFRPQPHKGLEYGDVAAQINVGSCAYEMKGIIKKNTMNSGRTSKSVDVLLNTHLLSTSKAGEEIIRQFVEQGLVDNRVDLIAVIAPQYFDNSFKGTLRFLAKLGGKKVMFIELDDVARLIEGNSAIDV